MKFRWLYSVLLLAAAGASGRDALRAAPPRIELVPVLTSGLQAPVLVTNARDGSRRLFILEQPGRIRVLQPGEASPSLFLDISPKTLAGGERGLLGLAFHPQYAGNGRFFVNYTRASDGATVIAEYQVSPSDPDAADPGEKTLLVIEQPFSNHNGGMIEFGPDGFLYIAVGDGGSGNDPGNRSQNPADLLGKILRIDVDRPAAGKPYAVPPDNPFFGTGAGREEIYALGLRNPWRFSFDRGSGRLFAGDVGQNRLEEVNIVTLGGNYGWRIFEGKNCTNLGPAPCASGGFTPPILEYEHAQGRCSVTGGYVYRGTRQSLPFGSYVYGDYCSGEIFLWSGGEASVLLQSGVNIASFGEDEAGEIYVAGLGGTVHRIASPDAPAQPTLYFPRLSTRGGGAAADEFTGFAVSNLSGFDADLRLTAFGPGGQPAAGEGLVNPVPITLQARKQFALLDTEIFGQRLGAGESAGWIRLQSSLPELAALFLSFDSGLNVMDGTDAVALPLAWSILPDIEGGGITEVHVANPNSLPASVRLELVDSDGSTLESADREVQGKGVLAESAATLFPGRPASSSHYMKIVASQAVAALEFPGRPGLHTRSLRGQDATLGATTLYCPQYVVGGPYITEISVINLDAAPGAVSFRFIPDDGTAGGPERELAIPGHGKILVAASDFFADFGNTVAQGHVEIRSSGVRLTGSVAFRDPAGNRFATALPLVTEPARKWVFSQTADNQEYFTGMSILNPGVDAALVRVEGFDDQGVPRGIRELEVGPNARRSGLLKQFFPELSGTDISSGYILITADRAVAAFAVFGTRSLSALAAIPAQAMAR